MKKITAEKGSLMEQARSRVKQIPDLQQENDYLMEMLNQSFETATQEIVSQGSASLNRMFQKGGDGDLSPHMDTFYPRTNEIPQHLTPMYQKSLFHNLNRGLLKDLPPELITQKFDERKAKELTQSAVDIQDFLKDTALDRFINNEPPTNSEDTETNEYFKTLLQNVRDIQTFLHKGSSEKGLQRRKNRHQETQKHQQNESNSPQQYMKLLENTAVLLESRIDEMQSRARTENSEDKPPETATFPKTPFGPKGEILVPQFTCRGDFRQAQVSAIGEIFRKNVYSSTEAFKPHRDPFEDLFIPTSDNRVFTPTPSGPPKPRHKAPIGCDLDCHVCPSVKECNFALSTINAKFQKELYPTTKKPFNKKK